MYKLSKDIKKLRKRAGKNEEDRKHAGEMIQEVVVKPEGRQ